MADNRLSKTLGFARGRKPSLSPLVPGEGQKKGRRVLGLQLPGSSQSRSRDPLGSARLRSTSSTNMAMLCIPSANLELLSALQQDMHGSLNTELELDSWELVSETIQKTATTNTVVIAGVGTRWSRPCRVLFKTLSQAVASYRELAMSAPVQLLLVDHETSTGLDLEKVPIGVPATFVFVRGVPVLFKRPITNTSDSGAAATAAGGNTAKKSKTGDNENEGDDDDDDNNVEDHELVDVDEGEEGGMTPDSPATLQSKTRKCMVGTLSIAQAEFLVEHCVSAASRMLKTMSQNVTSPIVDLYEDLDSPFAQELRIRRR